MGPIGSPETSLRNYHYTLRDNSEESRSHFLYHFIIFCKNNWGLILQEPEELNYDLNIYISYLHCVLQELQDHN